MVSKLLGFETFPIILMVSVSVSQFFGIEKSIGIGFEKFWYRKKYRYRFRKKLVLKKVSVSVSENFGIEKSIGIGFDFFWHCKVFSSYKLVWLNTLFQVFSNPLRLLHTDSFP